MYVKKVIGCVTFLRYLINIPKFPNSSSKFIKKKKLENLLLDHTLFTVTFLP